jgi:bifunctional DNA-binding transcriptional regulator/antitoxin component of YhaV-PrlF toxin-antitoxin module
MVIPKPLREKYGWAKGSRVKIRDEGRAHVLQPEVDEAGVGLRGIMRGRWRLPQVDRLIEEARASALG